jgi:Uma2 family endonuclease
MAQVALPLLTVQDYYEMPEGGPHCQLIDGDIHMMPPPNRYHQSISVNIVAIIILFLRKKRIGRVFYAPIAVILSEVNAYEPDVVFVSNERKNILTDRGIEGAPDFVVEILSPGTARFDKGPKRTIYARTGVQEYWLVDPKKLEVHVFRLQEDSETAAAIYREGDKFTSPIFPGLTFDTAEIFAD